jgi:hypothetical protein
MADDPLDKLANLIGDLASRIDAMESGTEKGRQKSLDADQKKALIAAASDLARADSIPYRIRENKRLRDELDAKERLLSQSMREVGPLTDRDRSQMAEIQARFDSVLSNFGKQAPRPLEGESPRMYRVRLLNDLKRYHPELKNANLRAAGPMENLDVLEKCIFDSAIAEAKRPTMDLPEDGGLRAIKRFDESGRQVTEYVGKNTFVRKFAAPTVFKATKIYTPQELALAAMVNNSVSRH